MRPSQCNRRAEPPLAVGAAAAVLNADSFCNCDLMIVGDGG